jgi:hypothetical protein
VDLSAGEAEVYYDTSQLKDVQRISDAITASGYPAKAIRIVTADQIRKERDLAASRSLHYIASVGEWRISRDDFDKEFKFARNRYVKTYGKEIFTSDRGKLLNDNLKAQIVSRLVNEGVQMQEIRRSGFSVDQATVDDELQAFLNRKGTELEAFKTGLEQNGYGFEYFLKKFENRVLINRYLDNKVLDGATDRFEKQRRYRSWFNNAKLLARVVYYDKDIERLVQTRSAGGCSGGGCSGGGGCSAAK